MVTLGNIKDREVITSLSELKKLIYNFVKIVKSYRRNKYERERYQIP